MRTASAAFASVERELLDAGRTLGATERALLFWVIIPMSYRGLLAGLALAFARALGEFGATLMVAGSIPGRTQTLPLALYAAVQAGKGREALGYTVLLSVVAFVVLASVGAYQKSGCRSPWGALVEKRKSAESGHRAGYSDNGTALPYPLQRL